MGLDLEPLGKAKPGNEKTWVTLTQTLYAGKTLSDDESRKLIDISVPPYAEIGAPMVGKDRAADEWMMKQAKAHKDNRPEQEIIAQAKGYFVVELLLGKCDGVPAYSNGGLGYVSAVTFRGEFPKDCTAFLDQPTIELAWRTVIPPAAAVSYGKALLARLDRPSSQPPAQGSLRGAIDRVLGGNSTSIQEQRQIIDAAGRWYVFWGARGNPIWANF
ncbi:MAG: hypothetical protein ABI740_04500 [Alphaproteobacteria bacterium]